MRWLVAFLLAWPAFADLEFVADETPPLVFAGSPQTVRATIRNTGADTEVDVAIRVVQLTAGSAVPVGEAQPWKKLRVLAKQTVLEDLPVELPAVRAPVRFRLECAGIGKLVVTAVPADYLKQLGDGVGVFDPGGKLRAVLKAAKIEFTDLETAPRHGKLAVVVAEKLPESVKNMAVVWLKPARVPVVVVRRQLVVAPPVDLTTAAGQASLIRYAELAVTPENEE